MSVFVDPGFGKGATLVVDHDKEHAEFLRLPAPELVDTIEALAAGRPVQVDGTGVGLLIIEMLRERGIVTTAVKLAPYYR